MNKSSILEIFLKEPSIPTPKPFLEDFHPVLNRFDAQLTAFERLLADKNLTDEEFTKLHKEYQNLLQSDPEDTPFLSD
jgi:hypothetical protein